MDTKPAKSKKDRGASSASARAPHAKDRPAGPSGNARARFLPPDDVLTLLVIIVVIGAWLRLSGLALQSLWLDEIWTYYRTHYPTLSAMLTGGLTRDIHPPLFYILQYYLQKYVGDSETILRLPSAVAGVLSVPVIFLLGRRLYSDREGLAAAALMAVLWCPVYYSQEARANMIMVLFSMLSMYFWIALVTSLCRKERPDLWTIIGFAGSTVVAGYVHYYGLLLVGLAGLAAAVVLLIKQPRALLALPLFYLPLLLVYIPWLPTMLRSTKTAAFGSFDFGRFPIIAFFKWAFNPGREAIWVAAAAVYAWLLGRTIYDAARKRTDPGWKPAPNASGGPATPYAGLFLVLWLVVPFAVSHLQSAVWRSTLTLRNMMICLPAVYLLAARGIARIPVARVYHLAIAVAVFVALLAELLFGMRYYVTPAKDQYREAVAYVVMNDAKYPRSLIVGWKDPIFDYYFAKLGSRRRLQLNLWDRRAEYDLAREIQARGPDYLWLISGHWKIDPEFLAFMKSRYTLVDSKELVCAWVFLYKNEPPPASAP